MEQTTQQITPKPSLPIKTRIAAWLMIITAVSGTLFFRLTFMSKQAISGAEIGAIFVVGAFYFIILPLGLLICISGIFLLKRKRWAWWFSVVIFSIFSILAVKIVIGSIIEESIYGVEVGYIVFLILIILSPLIPVILLLLDRKNFWKIAT